MSDLNDNDTTASTDIAIIGMAGRFPRARNIEELWRNLTNGVDALTHFSDEELRALGVSEKLLVNPNYVKAGMVLEDLDQFDANFFGFNPREAELMDPQQRIFLECAWEALEDAGYSSERSNLNIGVYSGADLSRYLVHHICRHRAAVETLHLFDTVMLGNGGDFMPTQVSYRLNLKGPSINVQTACSTSLVAVHLACQGLLSGECEIALAGGVATTLLTKEGYLYEEGGIFSPDGHCRAFDAQARGTVAGSGAGIIVLKRLDDALAHGDTIQAIIKGSAINNDGSTKAGYTSPSVDGQARVILDALSVSGVSADTISYIETHGTGTSLGDPIEFRALTKVFRSATKASNFCGLGSIKTNIGHLNSAAGIAGLIKTVLALKHKQLPPSLHYQSANSQINFDNSPFYINSSLKPWRAGETPLRAGVSSFGFGGTNAHIILEEPPVTEASAVNKPWQLITVSAKTASALETATERLANFLKMHPETALADAAYTLQLGRREFEHRRAVICQDTQDAIQCLLPMDPTRVLSGIKKHGQRVVFMFPGGGAQYVDMGRELYQAGGVFRTEIERCAELLQPQLAHDFRAILYPDSLSQPEAATQMRRTSIALPILFAVEYALARQWMAWGVEPHAMIGHSLGEYVAACLADALSLKDALDIVVLRGRLFEKLPSGAMLSVPLPEEEIERFLDDELSIAAINSPYLCVASGPVTAIDRMSARLSEYKIDYSKLYIDVAAHSSMVETILPEFTEFIKQLERRPPSIPYISNVTGNWITAEETTDPLYYARHLRQTVRFADGIGQLNKDSDLILLEVGPGRTLTTLAKQHPDRPAGQLAISSLPHPTDRDSALSFILNSLARLWLNGIEIDWAALYPGEQRKRISLPTYPFERKRFWFGEQHSLNEPTQPEKNFLSPLEQRNQLADWFYLPTWQRSLIPAAPALTMPVRWLLFVDDELTNKLAARLSNAGIDITLVKAGEKFVKLSEQEYLINPQQSADYHELLQSLAAQNKMPNQIVHLWNVNADSSSNNHMADLYQAQEKGFFSLLYLAQALGNSHLPEQIGISVISTNLHDVIGSEQIAPAKATLLGPILVIPQEYPQLTTRSIDIQYHGGEPNAEKRLLDQLANELISPFDAAHNSRLIAYRGSYRWEKQYQPIQLGQADPSCALLRERGVYLITGGLGGIGLELAEQLARRAQARLILVGRSRFPARDEWQQWLDDHDANDAVSIKIRRLQALEQAGAELMIAAADISDKQQISELISQACSRFGVINGVIHAAGLLTGGIIQLKTRQAIEETFRPKIAGIYELLAALQDNGLHLDLLVFCSTTVSIFGEFGQVDHCAANAFLDALAQTGVKVATQTVSINWDAWRDVGMATYAELPDKLQELRAERLKFALTAAEGQEVFARILDRPLAQIVVSTQELAAKFEQAAHALAELQVPEKSAAVANNSRPDIASPYVAPTNWVEKRLVDIWQDLLGLKPVGIYDSFLELGGHSLLAIQLISRINEELQVTVAMSDLFEQPTIANLSNIVLQKKAESTDVEMLAQFIAEADMLSDDELQAILATQQESEETE